MINKKLVATLSLTALLVLPLIVSAATIPATPIGGYVNIAQIVTVILDFMWKIFVAAFFIFLFISAFLFLSAQGEPDGIAKARQALIWSVASLVIAILVFSIPIIVFNIFPGA